MQFFANKSQETKLIGEIKKKKIGKKASLEIILSIPEEIAFFSAPISNYFYANSSTLFY